jgi:pyruvate,water dikinase
VNQTDPAVELWGEAAVNLAMLHRHGIVTAPAFVLSAAVQAAFFGQTKLKESIEKELHDVSVKRPQTIPLAAKAIRQKVLRSGFPPEVHQSLEAYYIHLREMVLQAKATHLCLLLQTAEDSLLVESTSVDDVLKGLRQLYVLQFSPERLHARLQKNGIILPRLQAVRITYVGGVELAGTAQYYDPQTMDGNTLVIKTGRHDNPLSLEQAEEVYRFDRQSQLLLSYDREEGDWSKSKTGQHTKRVPRGQDHRLLSDEQLQRISRVAAKVQEQYPDPVRIDWMVAHGQILVIQVEKVKESIPKPPVSPNQKVLLVGAYGILGSAFGPVRRIMTAKDRQGVVEGDIVVVEHLVDTDYQWLAGCAGLIIETGHAGSLEARLAERMGVPAVVGASNARNYLKEGQMVTLDGYAASVYLGRVPVEAAVPDRQTTTVITGTKLYAVISDLTQFAPDQIAGMDGIGLLRSEHLLDLIGMHPLDIVRRGQQDEYADILAENLEYICRSAYPRPVVYQLHDLQSSIIAGGLRFRHEHHSEGNPLLGHRGMKRLLNDPDVLVMEVKAIEKVFSRGYENLQIMLPMLRSADEVGQFVRQWESMTGKSAHPELWVKCETPATAILVEDMVAYPVAGVAYAVPALSQLVVGIDQNNIAVGHQLDQADPAVLHLLGESIATARQHHLATAVVSEGVPMRPEAVEAAVRSGVTAVCVRRDDAAEMQRLVASIEKRMLLDHLVEEAV